MKKYLILLTVSLMAVLSAQSALEQGHAAYDRRAEGSVEDHAQAGPIDEAIAFFEEALKDPATEEEAALYLLKCYYFRGKYVDSDEEAQKADFQRGKKLGETYIAKYPESAAIRYWYLANLGSWAEVYGIFAAAKEGVADIMREHSERIIQLDPEYQNGGGYFMLGAVHYKSPYIPFFLSWPDNDEAVTYLQKAVSIGEATPNQKVYLAQALYKDGQKATALELLEEVANMTPSADEPVEDWEQIKKARGLLEKYR
jgi:tetratricopeptide (TPR) repeat protein